MTDGCNPDGQKTEPDLNKEQRKIKKKKFFLEKRKIKEIF